MLLVSQCNGFQMDRHKIIPHQTTIKTCDMLVLTIYDMPAIRYGPREADMEEVVERRIGHLAKGHSSEQWRLLSSAPCHSVILFRILQSNIPKKSLLTETSCCKACHQKAVKQMSFPARSEAGLGRKMLRIRPAVLKIRPEAQGGKLHLDATTEIDTAIAPLVEGTSDKSIPAGPIRSLANSKLG